jgi:hypothetical protein
MANTNQQYAVLTGDLVKSSKLSAAQSKKAMERLRKAADKFGQTCPESTVGRLDTFRHDSWQMLLAKPELGLRAAVFLRAALKLHSDAKVKYDTRISIGIGTVESISKRRISDSRGEAFTWSGKGLDAMDAEGLVFALPQQATPRDLWAAKIAVPLFDCIVGDWTATESRAVYGALMGWTQEETAKQWPGDDTRSEPPTRQAVAKALSRAHWTTVESVLKTVETGIKQPPEVASA